MPCGHLSNFMNCFKNRIIEKERGMISLRSDYDKK